MEPSRDSGKGPRNASHLLNPSETLRSQLHLKRIEDGIPAAISEPLSQLINARGFDAARRIPGAQCLPFYEESYAGTFNASASKALPDMIPGFRPPTDEQIAKIEQWKKAEPSRADLAYGTMNSKESALVQCVIRALNPRTMFEFGTHQGILTNRMISAAPEDCVMLTLDIPPSELSSGRGIIASDRTNLDYVRHSDDAMGIHIEDKYQNRVIRMIGDSMRLDVTHLREKIDLVVVDGGHQYPVAARDIKNAWEMLSPGGVLLIDDYKTLRTEGVMLAVMEHRRNTGAPAYLINFFKDLETDMVMFIKE